jgi:hypothetical protein
VCFCERELRLPALLTFIKGERVRTAVARLLRLPQCSVRSPRLKREDVYTHLCLLLKSQDLVGLEVAKQPLPSTPFHRSASQPVAGHHDQDAPPQTDQVQDPPLMNSVVSVLEGPGGRAVNLRNQLAAFRDQQPVSERLKAFFSHLHPPNVCFLFL